MGEEGGCNSLILLGLARSRDKIEKQNRESKPTGRSQGLVRRLDKKVSVCSTMKVLILIVFSVFFRKKISEKCEKKVVPVGCCELLVVVGKLMIPYTECYSVYRRDLHNLNLTNYKHVEQKRRPARRNAQQQQVDYRLPDYIYIR